MRQFDRVLLQLRVHGQHLGRGAEAEAGHRCGQVQDGLLGAAVGSTDPVAYCDTAYSDSRLE